MSTSNDSPLLKVREKWKTLRLATAASSASDSR